MKTHGLMQGTKTHTSSFGMRKGVFPRFKASSFNVQALGSSVQLKTIERFGRHSRETSVNCRAKAGNLPWQVAMSEIKKRRDIKSIMSKSRAIWYTSMSRFSDKFLIVVIGAGPIVIGQACEFDYSGTQACKSLRYACHQWQQLGLLNYQNIDHHTGRRDIRSSC